MSVKPSDVGSGTLAIEDRNPRGHSLVQVTERILDWCLDDDDFHRRSTDRVRTRFFRCRKCGQERTEPSAFGRPCPIGEQSSMLTALGYSIEDPRTRRALTEDMDVQFDDREEYYHVSSTSGNDYVVDIGTSTCTCPDHEKRRVRCKHLRRVDLEIGAGQVPGPDGTFRRTIQDSRDVLARRERRDSLLDS